MAPERLLKRPADEVRGDVYALGVTLLEALTLSPPVEMPDDLPRALWISFLASASPRIPSSVWPKIPERLEDTILRATSHDPTRRHPSAGQFADELERFLSDRAQRWRGNRGG
jgi:serine/threonine protein kinase